MSMKNKDNSGNYSDCYFPTDYVKESEVVKLLTVVKGAEIVFDMNRVTISVVKTDAAIKKGEEQISNWKIITYDVGNAMKIYTGKIGGYDPLKYDVKIINDYFIRRDVVEEVNKCKTVLNSFIKKQTSYDNIKNYETLLQTLNDWSSYNL